MALAALKATHSVQGVEKEMDSYASALTLLADLGMAIEESEGKPV